jgi:hypothetical protein
VRCNLSQFFTDGLEPAICCLIGFRAMDALESFTNLPYLDCRMIAEVASNLAHQIALRRDDHRFAEQIAALNRAIPSAGQDRNQPWRTHDQQRLPLMGALQCTNNIRTVRPCRDLQLTERGDRKERQHDPQSGGVGGIERMLQ